MAEEMPWRRMNGASTLMRLQSGLSYSVHIVHGPLEDWLRHHWRAKYPGLLKWAETPGATAYYVEQHQSLWVRPPSIPVVEWS